MLQGYLTLEEKTQQTKGFTTGFDYLRVILSLSVLIWHSVWYSGSHQIDSAVGASRMRFIVTGILPLFFALSGYLVAGSLVRTKIYQFLTLRVIRLFPALAVEVLLSALILGPLFTKLSLREYFKNTELHLYFLNMFGYIHYTLPGVFEKNPGGPYINAQLWTVPFELECYIALVLLSILTIFRRKIIYYFFIMGICLSMTVWPIGSNPQGRQLVMCFLVATMLYQYRSVVPYNNVLGFTSALLTAVFLITPGCEYFVPFSAAYAVVWVGLMSPPRILFGDLSYGVFLFHLPIEQSIMYLSPSINTWWLLSITAIPITFAFAWLSWNFVESPILSQKKNIVSRMDVIWDKISNNLKYRRIQYIFKLR